MEALFELVLELLCEGGLQLLAHLFGDLGANVVASYRRRGKPRAWISAIGHLLFGAAMGGLSLLVFRHSFAHSEVMRLVALIGSPLLAGCFSMLLGTRRRDAGRDWVAFETFTYGVLFAFAFALVRYLATAPG
jgi:hypothetical protein